VRDRRDSIFAIDAKAAALGVQYVNVWERHSFDPSVWPALRRLIRDQQIDIVHSHDYKTNLLAYLLWKVDPIVPLSTVHGWSGHSAKERYVYYPIDQRLLARFPRVVAVSGQIKSVLVARGAVPQRISVVLNGIDHRVYRRDRGQEARARAELGVGPEDRVIGSIGRLEPEKRYDLLIEATAALLPDLPHIRLIIAGGGSQRDALSRHAAERLPQHSYRLLGHRDDVIRLHHGFDCYVQSSDTEGTSNSVLEAMALETPIVATDVGGTSELIRSGQEGFIVKRGDTVALTQAITQVLCERSMTADMVHAARLRVETDLSFEHRMNHIERIYEEIA
jgi:glycosyltransferase involved in cell wall biosynthesis